MTIWMLEYGVGAFALGEKFTRGVVVDVNARIKYHVDVSRSEE